MRTPVVVRAGLLLIACVASCVHARIGRLADGTITDTILTLDGCFEIAHAHNAQLRQAASAVVATYGEKIRSRGRFLPRVDLLYDRAGTDTDSGPGVNSVRDEALKLQIRQRVIELGRTSDTELGRRDRERAALYEKENTIVAVLSTVRRLYYSLLVVEQQRTAHDTLLTHYAERMRQSGDRLDKGVGLRTAVLTARMNWLDERERILDLEAKRQAVLAQLKEVLGAKSLPATLRLVEPAPIALPVEDSCVERALVASTEIADSKGELLQAAQALSQTGWEFVLGDLSFSALVHKSGRAAGLELSRGDQIKGERTWVLDAVGTKILQESDDELIARQDSSLTFSAALEISIPVFRGASRHATVMETGARYSEARAALIARTRSVEKQTREAFYAFQTARQRLEIQNERVTIARERYMLAETQHELGRINDEDLESTRERLFRAQDGFYAQQFGVIQHEEDLRMRVRVLE